MFKIIMRSDHLDFAHSHSNRFSLVLIGLEIPSLRSVFSTDGAFGCMALQLRAIPISVVVSYLWLKIALSDGKQLRPVVTDPIVIEICSL